jgi:hypothetical protein
LIADSLICPPLPVRLRTGSARIQAAEKKSINDIPLDFDLTLESGQPVDDEKGGKQGSELSRYYDRAVFLLIPKINRGFI